MFEVISIDLTLIMSIERDRMCPPRRSSRKSRSNRSCRGLAFLPEPRRQRSIRQWPVGQFGQSELGVVDIALELASRDRQGWDRSVTGLDPVPRMAPALVAQTLRRTSGVLHGHVRIHDRRTHRSSQRSDGVVLQWDHQLVNRASRPILAGRISHRIVASARAVVGAVRLSARACQFAGAELVKDLAQAPRPGVVALRSLGAAGRPMHLSRAAGRRPKL